MVGGNVSSLSNNYARESGMALQHSWDGASGATITVPGDSPANYTHGANVAAPNYNCTTSVNWWTGANPGFTNNNTLGNWYLGVGRLPWLGGFTGTQNPSAP